MFDAETAIQFDWWRRTPVGQNALLKEYALINKTLRPKAGESVLDVGCGPGFHLRQFQQWNMKPIGIDSSPTMVELAKQRVGFSIPIFKGYAEDLPFKDDHFDVVVFVTSLEFMDSPEKALREAVRVAKKRLLIIIHNAYSPGTIRLQCSSLFTNTFYRNAKFLNLWKLKKMIRREVGMAKILWGSTQTVPLFLPTISGHENRNWSFDSPFAQYLAICVILAVPIKQSEHIFDRGILERSPFLAKRSIERIYEKSTFLERLR